MQLTKRGCFSNSEESCLVSVSQVSEVYEHCTKQDPLMLRDVCRDMTRHAGVNIAKMSIPGFLTGF